MKHLNDESKISLHAVQRSRVSRFVRETSSWMLIKESSDGVLRTFLFCSPFLQCLDVRGGSCLRKTLWRAQHVVYKKLYISWTSSNRASHSRAARTSVEHECAENGTLYKKMRNSALHFCTSWPHLGEKELFKTTISYPTSSISVITQGSSLCHPRLTHAENFNSREGKSGVIFTLVKGL